jgi:hypothetical protein
MKFNVTYELVEVPLRAMTLLWSVLVVAHVILALLATRCVLNRRKETTGPIGSYLAIAWLIPVVGPSWVLWSLRTAPPPLLK